MKKNSDYLAKGLLLSLILIVVDLIGGFANIRFETWFRWLPSILAIGILITFCIQFGKREAGGVTFGQVFGYGFKISLIVSILMVVYSLVSFAFIFPELTDQILAKTRTDLQAAGKLTDDQIDTQVAMTKKFMQPGIRSIFFFLVSLFFYTIGSLLGAAFTKKTETDVFNNKS